MSAHPPTADIPKTPGLKAATIALVLLLLALLWSGLFYHLASQRSLQLAHAERDTATLNRVYATQVEGTLNAADQILRLVKRIHESRQGAIDPSLAVPESALLKGAGARVQIVGPDGLVHSATGDAVYRGDQDGFRALVARDDDLMLVGRPESLEANAAPTIPLARRLDLPDGSFDGVVMMSLDSQTLSTVLASDADSNRITMGVIGLDHVIRILSGNLPRVFGTVGEPLNAPWLFEAQDAAPNGVETVRSRIDGATRVVAWRTLEGYPLFVASSRDEDEILATFNWHRRALITAAAVISGIFILAGLLLLRVFDQRDALTASVALSRATLLEAQELGKIGHWVSDLRTGRVNFSDECFKMMGRSPTPALPTRDALAAFHPDDLPRYQAVRDGDGGDIEMRVVHADGGIRWVHIRIQPRYDAAGKRVSLFGVVQDITERKVAEAELLEGNRQLRETERLGRVGSVTWDRATDRVYWSDVMFELLDVPKREFFTRAESMAHLHPEDREMYVRARAAGVAARRDYGCECRLVRSDGTIAWARIVGHPTFDDAGALVSLHAVHHDITDIREAERALRRSEERYALAVDGIQEGMFDRDVKAGTVWFSERAHRILGLADGALNGNRQNFLVRIHPDELAAWEQEVSRQMAARESYDAGEFRMRHADGSWRWIATRGRIVYDDDGAAVRVVGSFGDITSRKAAEAALVDSNRRLVETEHLGRVGWLIVDYSAGRVTWSDTLFELRRVPKRESFTLEAALAFVHPDDIPAYFAARDAGVAGRCDFVCDTRVVRPDGTVGWEHIVGRPQFNDAGELVGLHLAVRDNTEVREAELALRRSEERYALALEGMREGLFDRDIGADTMWFSERVHQLLGLPDGALNGSRQHYVARIHPNDLTLWENVLSHLMAARELYHDGEFRMRHADGTWRWLATRGRIVYGDDGAALRVVGSFGDVTTRKVAEAALLENHQHLLETQRLGRVGSMVWDRTTNHIQWSDSVFELFDVPKRAFFERDESLRFLHPDDVSRYNEARDSAIAARRDFSCDCRARRPDGSVLWMHLIGHPRFDDAGELSGIHIVVVDNTEIHQAEIALRRSEERYALAVEGMREGLFDRDVKAGTIWISPHGHELLGFPDGALNGDREAWAGLIHPDDRREYEALFRQVVATRTRHNSSIFRMRRSDGAWRWIVYRGLILYDDDGAPVRTIGSVGDITEQRLAEQGLREREQQLRAIMDNAPVEIFLKDRNRRYLLVNQEYSDALGRPIEEIIGHTDAEIFPEIAELSRISDEAVIGHGQTQRIERAPIKPRPGFEHIEILKFPILGGDGSVVGLAGFTFNTTERRRIEEQLRQAAGMEAVGRLASGIAHDFNNMIGAITGFSSFLIEDLAPGTAQRRFAERIAQVCEHAKDVVKQVLAFGRAGNVEKHLVDLRALVGSDEPLFRAAMAVGTRLTVDTGPAPLPMLINEGQLHQVLLNLCLNANDALAGETGTVAVRLERVDPAHRDRARFATRATSADQAVATGGGLDPQRHYAVIRVADSGVGMDQATLDRIFEPFYTTKGAGRGTGLGLAVIHGIVNAYDGAFRVTSRPGHGSEFAVYLPLAAADAIAAPAGHDADTPRGEESILLIDDDADMAAMMAIGLERLGYDLTRSHDPTEALAAFTEDPGAWDIVVTDQSMPGLLGTELARRIKHIRPDCPVVLYTGDAARIGGAGARDDGGADIVLLKPIEPREVAGHIRRLLDQRAVLAADA